MLENICIHVTCDVLIQGLYTSAMHCSAIRAASYSTESMAVIVCVVPDGRTLAMTTIKVLSPMEVVASMYGVPSVTTENPLKVVMDQNATDHVNADIFQNNLLPDARRHYGNNWKLADVNNRSHSANVVLKFLEGVDITRLDW